jgi:hypothetical protein
MSTTAGDQINAALRLIGQLAEGETPSDATSQDALAALNQMLDSWSTERLAVYSTQDQVFTWPANDAIRTLGPTGDFVGTRPVQLDTSSYFRDTESGVSFGVYFINQDQYNNIALKTVTSTYPQMMWVNNTHPDITMASKRNLKRINNPDDLLAMPYNIMGRRNQRFNIFTGNY